MKGRRVIVAEQMGGHCLADPLHIRLSEADAKAPSDDHRLDVEQIDSRGDTRPEREDRSVDQLLGERLALKARAQIPLVNRSRSCSFMTLNRTVCFPALCSLRALASIAARPA